MLKVGIIGAGGMGGAHARQYRKMPDVELTFFDKSIERTEAFSKQWDASPSVSAEDLISACDLVDICLPTDLHLDLGLRAIAAGRALFVEKPMAGSVEDCVKLTDAASAAGVPLMPGQVVRYFPEFKRGHDVVKRGGVGEPAAARTRRGGFAPTGMDKWFLDHARSGGVILDLAIHDFDWLRWTIGEVTQVYSRSVGISRGTGTDYALTTLTFENGAVGHVEATWMDPAGFRTTFEVAGSAGIVEHDSRNVSSLRTHVFEGDPLERKARSAAEGNMSPTDDPFYLQLSDFVRAVKDGTPPPVSGHDGAMAVSIAVAALESAKTGRVVAPARV